MSLESVMLIVQMAMMTALSVAGPILVAGLIAGLLVSIFQAVTQIHEMTLTFIPKIIAVGAVAIIFFNFMMTAMLDFTIKMLTTFPHYLGK